MCHIASFPFAPIIRSNTVTLLALYEKLERLVQRLPEKLQSPIMREITPIKSLFLKQRAPRLLLLGDRASSRSALANALFRASVAAVEEDHVQSGGWQVFSNGRGRLQMLDARRPALLAGLRRALTTEPPDACLFLHVEPRSSEDVAADLDQARQILEALGPEVKLPIFGVCTADISGAGPETARQHLHDALKERAGDSFTSKIGGYFLMLSATNETAQLATAIARDLEPEARLEMGRLSGVKELQRESAMVMIRSISGICAAVGAQPIPLADLPILTSLQAAMVAGVMHISGREMNMKLAGQWVTALGANIGIALALREGARAVLKFVPVWGDLLSGGIAAAGTFAIGRAAVAYFIDGVELPDARRLFKKAKKEPPQLQSPQQP